MGRTILSYRMALENEIQSWKPFRDVLRIDEREVFDDLMNLARERASAGGAPSPPSNRRSHVHDHPLPTPQTDQTTSK